MIVKLRHFAPSSVLTNIYKSLILPYLTYGLVAWGNASKNYLNKIVVLQKRVLRLIYFVDRKERAIPLFVNAKILNILETEDSFMKPDEIMLKFKHSKIESN